MNSIKQLLVICSLTLISACGQTPQSKKTQIIIDPIIDQPKYPGGIDSLNSFLAREWRPAKTTCVGTSYIEFIVTAEGSIRSIAVAKTLATPCDTMAVRLVRAMPKWIPATEGDKATSQKVMLGIKFDLLNPYL